MNIKHLNGVFSSAGYNINAASPSVGLLINFLKFVVEALERSIDVENDLNEQMGYKPKSESGHDNKRQVSALFRCFVLALI